MAASELKKAFIVGYTGEVGKLLTQRMLADGRFQMRLIGRRQVDDPSLTACEQVVVDYEKLDESADSFSGCDFGFCCLGTTRGKSGAEGFRRVDHDYCMKVAELAKQGGCSHYHLDFTLSDTAFMAVLIPVSSKNANKDSSNLYFSVKGAVEEETAALNFDKYTIYRPGMLMVDRKESRPGEAVLRFLMKPLAAVAPNFITTPIDKLVPVMIDQCFRQTEPRLTMEIKDIMTRAGELEKAASGDGEK